MEQNTEMKISTISELLKDEKYYKSIRDQLLAEQSLIVKNSENDPELSKILKIIDDLIEYMETTWENKLHNVECQTIHH